MGRFGFLGIESSFYDREKKVRSGTLARGDWHKSLANEEMSSRVTGTFQMVLYGR